MKGKDNGSTINVVEKAKDIAKEKKCPDTIEVITGNSFPDKDALTFQNDINGELKRRFDHYIVKYESDITLFSGMIKVKLTKKQ